jgi:hypothetical protein
MTCHMTMYHVDGRTETVQIASPLTPPQRAFLALHASPNPPHTWRWHFAGTQLRACGDAGCATLWKDDVTQLVTWGLLKWGHGCADVVLTELGRAQVATPQRLKGARINQDGDAV